jgi:hypothetical protein
MAGTSNFAGISFGYDNNKYIEDKNSKTCHKWLKSDRVFQTCDVSVAENKKGCVILEGFVKNTLKNKLLSLSDDVYVQYWAPSPPDYRQSFSGSGLPFPNEEVAYQNSPNIGKIKLASNGSFRISLRYPNSYYKQLGAVYVKPNVKLLFRDEKGNMMGKIVTIVLGEGIPYRSLTWPNKQNWNKGPMFFCGRERLPVRTQAQILMDSAYPCVNHEAPNFWGLRPPLPEG